MEKVVKQIQLIALIIILISTVIAFGIEIFQMFENKKISLADLILLFLYLEVLAMVRVFWESQSIQITLPLFIAITALSRFIILQGKSINPEMNQQSASPCTGCPRKSNGNPQQSVMNHPPPLPTCRGGVTDAQVGSL